MFLENEMKIEMLNILTIFFTIGSFHQSSPRCATALLSLAMSVVCTQIA